MKDAYYFSHDSNARHDPKITAMRSVYGLLGYAWFWVIIEMLRESSGYKLDMRSKYAFNAFASEMQCDVTKAQEFIMDCIKEFELFESDGESFWSPSLLRRMVKREEISEKARKSAEARWKKKASSDKGSSSEESADALPSECERIENECESDALKESKGKESKRNKIKDKENKDLSPEDSDDLKIKDFRSRYSPEQLKRIDEYLDMIRYTRKHGKIAPTVILKIYEQFDKYPTICVEYGVWLHTKEPKHHSKDEKYTMGIIRNTSADESYRKLNADQFLVPSRPMDKNARLEDENRRELEKIREEMERANTRSQETVRVDPEPMGRLSL